MKLKSLLAVGIMAAILCGCGNSSTESERILGNSNGNINNLGSLCADDENYYFMNGEDDKKLYKEPIGGGEATKLNDVESYFINNYNDKIYYCSAADDFHIYSMNEDGSDNKMIVDQAAYYVTIYNDSIFYTNYDDSQHIYKASLDGSTNEKICDDTAFFVTAYNDKIYYINYNDNAKVYSVNLDGSERTCVVDNYCGFINLYKDNIYYTTVLNPETGEGDDSIHRFSLIDGTDEQVLAVSAENINVYNDRIYFTSLGDEKVFSCNMEGQDIKEELSENGLYVNVAGNRMIYVLSDGTNVSINTKELS